ncbi:interleukin-1 receptor accessory protein [Heteronotia binoei]|uniref:interleukin-1 receptor accessory protein n=1 Tax=Heteronotia binoei TaxID=13085 RepID=UPI00292D6725|nr:interleukin-1 receptor accessory protein [Heteronotia binoei]
MPPQLTLASCVLLLNMKPSSTHKDLLLCSWMKTCCLLLVVLGSAGFGSPSERCDDWGVDTMKHKPVYNGEPAKIRCPLFEAFLKYNYSTAHSAGLTLIWYWIGQGRDLEEPINFRLPDNRISKEKDILWFRPALLNDTGNYTCMLRNATYCSKVAFPLEVVNKDAGSCISQVVKPDNVMLYLEHTNVNLICPDVDGYFPAGVKPKVRWLRNCKLMEDFYERYPNGLNLTFGIVREVFMGDYTCSVTYKENGQDFNLTRTLRIKVVGAPEKGTPPQILYPNDIVYELPAGADLVLPCRVYFPYLKGPPPEVSWLIDGRNTDDISDLRINISQYEKNDSLQNMDLEKTLIVPQATEEDLKRNYTCYARNPKGEEYRQAIVKLQVPVPRYTVELACGLGATVFLVVILTVVYHVYWLEMVLFYRAHFGTDETILDGKEFDIYVSYARNAEEEEFVLLTLRGVLENEFGYKLCIFDRDSLPGGNITESIFDFIQRSRKMIVVLSPDYLLEKSISMLEFKLGLLCQNHIATKLIVIEYRPLQRAPPSIQQLKESVAFVTWKGEKSKRPGSRFWKALRLALPLRSLNAASSAWNESCSSHSDVSLDHAQKKKGRLKGPAEEPATRPGIPVQRGLPPLPRVKAKGQPKPFLACRCCVVSCNGNHRLRTQSRRGARHKWEVPKRPQPQSSAKPPPAASPVPALGPHQYADLSNNNDFYVL